MNLLPATEKDILKKGLKLRSVIVALIMASVFTVIGAAMLLPAYFLTKDQFSVITLQNSLIKEEDEESMRHLLSLPGEIESKLNFFEADFESASALDSFSKIIDYLPDKVKLNAVSFGKSQTSKEAAGPMILVAGISADRNSLVAFSTALQKSGLFSSVAVPVSNLAKDKDLPFTMTLFIKDKK